uniref:Uncharacterized protein n=1 Tax=Globisporangium ultimum (strain ATCC 200006 / CBS 805.95 / DAOM BR144) TaxID=431595 RepID=K3WEZ6_GLOUD
MRVRSCVELIAVAVCAFPSASAATTSATSYFKDDACETTPDTIKFESAGSCTQIDECVVVDDGAQNKMYTKIACPTESYAEYTQSVYEPSKYFIIETYGTDGDRV